MHVLAILPGRIEAGISHRGDIFLLEHVLLLICLSLYPILAFSPTKRLKPIISRERCRLFENYGLGDLYEETEAEDWGADRLRLQLRRVAFEIGGRRRGGHTWHPTMWNGVEVTGIGLKLYSYLYQSRILYIDRQKGVAVC